MGPGQLPPAGTSHCLVQHGLFSSAAPSLSLPGHWPSPGEDCRLEQVSPGALRSPPKPCSSHLAAAPGSPPSGPSLPDSQQHGSAWRRVPDPHGQDRATPGPHAALPREPRVSEAGATQTELFQTSGVCSSHASNKTQLGRDETLTAVRSQLKKKHLGASWPAPHKTREGETPSRGRSLELPPSTRFLRVGLFL